MVHKNEIIIITTLMNQFTRLFTIDYKLIGHMSQLDKWNDEITRQYIDEFDYFLFRPTKQKQANFQIEEDEENGLPIQHENYQMMFSHQISNIFPLTQDRTCKLRFHYTSPSNKRGMLQFYASI